MYRLRFVPRHGSYVSHGQGSVDQLKAKAQDMSPRSGPDEGVEIPLTWRDYKGGLAADVRLSNNALDGFWHIYPIYI